MLKLLASVTSEREIGAQVERLVCNYLIKDDIYLSMLPLLFPQLRVACFLDYKNNEDLKIRKHHPWTEHLEILMERHSDLLARQLLRSGKCPHLKTLVITSADYDKNDLAGMVTLLVNAPALETLQVTRYTFTLNDLNKLGFVLPRMKSISFIDCTLSDTKMTSPIIEPATSVTSLLLEGLQMDVRPLEIEAEFLMYVSKKYPKLSRIVYVDKNDYYHMPTEVNNRFRTAWLAIFSALNSHLRTLKFQRMEIGLNVCGLLDIANCRVEKLHVYSKRLYPLYDNIATSFQAQCVRNLTMEVQEFNTNGYQWLKGLCSLKKLKWIIQVYPQNPFSLNELIRVLPNSLEALSLKSVAKKKYAFNFNTLLPTRTLSIKSVSLCNIAITKEMESFLGNAIPNLHRLKLHQCKMDTPSLSFPKTRFTFLKISCDFQSMHRHIILTTAVETRRYEAKCWSTMGNQFKYLFGTQDTAMYPSIEGSPTVDFDFKPYVRITCYSVQDLIIIDHS